jgi:hypothetical protein
VIRATQILLRVNVWRIVHTGGFTSYLLLGQWADFCPWCDSLRALLQHDGGGMHSLSLDDMRTFLFKSVSSSSKTKVLNQNKVNGMLAEIAFRDHITSLGFGPKVSPGGWLIRSVRVAQFGAATIALFPEVVEPGIDYPPTRALAPPPPHLQPVGVSFQRIGIPSYLCRATITRPTPAATAPATSKSAAKKAERAAAKIMGSWLSWQCYQLGQPSVQQYLSLTSVLSPFKSRTTSYQPLHFFTNVAKIPDIAVPTQFSAEALRVAVQIPIFCEMSDIDGVLFGARFTYPLEIKEKTAAHDDDMGAYFGIDVGPFAKLAYYAAQQGQMQSIFIVHEIQDTTSRSHVAWWYITFDELARSASWQPRGGGTNMKGGASTVVRIPKCKFKVLDTAALASLP